MLKTQSPYRFHDTGSFMTLVKTEVPDISPEAVVYLEEAVAAFYAGCVLACCVMLGVAAEAEFLRLLDVARKNIAHGPKFAQAVKQNFIRQKITKFHDTLKPLFPVLPQNTVEDIDTNFALVQSVLRIARNDAGHLLQPIPSGNRSMYICSFSSPFAGSSCGCGPRLRNVHGLRGL